jgi:hypothetical protein
MKIIICLGVNLFLFFSCANLVKKYPIENITKNRFLRKTPLITTPKIYGQHISVIDSTLANDGYELRIDDRDIIAGLNFSKQTKILILEEYLNYENDTVKSNKYYYFRLKSYQGDWSIPKVSNFTIEIEALFSFTRMLTKGITPLVPTLIDRNTGKQINGDQKKVRKVFKIYKDWLARNKKQDFKDITLPLDGSPYCWLGEDKNIKSYLIESL